jgi:DNA gyrase/topoisomerase IV subunit A
MKQLFALAFFLLSIAATAQSTEAKAPAANNSANEAAAREATEKLVAKYTLNADQAKEMYTVQLRKLRNLGEITPLRDSNRSLYLAKLESLQKGTLGSIRRLLRSKEQVELYNKTQTDVRTQRAAKRKELAAQKPAKDDLQAALLEIYAE